MLYNSSIGYVVKFIEIKVKPGKESRSSRHIQLHPPRKIYTWELGKITCSVLVDDIQDSVMTT